MTLSKLAQLANVSVSVVSKAFSGRDDVSEAMRERVFAVAKEHGCFEQFYHAPYDKPVVVVIVPEVISEYYIKYIQLLKKGIEECGYTMLMSINNFDLEMTRELVRYYTEYGKVNGIILFGEMPKISKKADIAFISIGGSDYEAGSGVQLDISSGLSVMLKHLYDHGHKSVAYVGEPLTEIKRHLLEKTMSDMGIEVIPEHMICSRYRFADAGRDGTKKLLALENRPTAIVGAYGYITQGVIAELETQGVSIPSDMSVVSLGDDPYPLHPTLNVSYISSMTEKVCESVMQLLKERINSQNPNTPQVINILSEFVEGETVRIIKNK